MVSKTGRVVKVSVELAVEVGVDAVALERAAASEGRRAARELYLQALAEVDRCAVAESGGVRQRVERRWVATVIGRLRIGRSRVRTGDRTSCPLDDVIDLRPGEASPAIRAMVGRLAERRLSSGTIAEVLGEVSGTPFSRHVVQRMLREQPESYGERARDQRVS